jgi:hypothetical protein
VIVESFGMLVYFGLVIRIPGSLTFVGVGYFLIADRGGGASFSAPVYVELRDLASTAVRRIEDPKPPFVSVFDQGFDVSFKPFDFAGDDHRAS